MGLLRATRRSLLYPATAPAAGGAWSPLDLGSTLKGWWDFSDASTLYTDAGTTLVSSDGDLIDQVNDKSGSGWHARQATLTARPVYKVAIQNGRSVARFVDDTDLLATIDNHPFGGGATYTITAVVSMMGNFSTMWSLGTSLSKAAMGFRRNNNSPEQMLHWWYGSDLSTTSAGIANNTWYIFTAEWDGTVRRVYVNGVLRANQTLGGLLLGASPLHIGYDYINNRSLLGDYAELHACSVLSASQKNAQGNYLATKWGLAWTDIT